MVEREDSCDANVKKSNQTIKTSEYKILTEEQCEHFMKLKCSLKRLLLLNPAKILSNLVISIPVKRAAIPLMSTPGLNLKT